jgi:hypothetical protein
MLEGPMRRSFVAFAFMCVIAPAFAVQEVTLQDLPPLQPLHYCKSSDGQVAAQRDPCGSDTTEVSSVAVRRPDGTLNYLPLEKQQSTDATADRSAASDSASRDVQNAGVKNSPLGDFWKRMARWIGFALVVGLVAKLLKQSFVLWLVLGFVLRAILVALNVMAF